jgi:pentatricopeptide repeat protein
MTQTTVLPPDAEVFGAIIRKLADKNRIQEALALFDEATDNGLQIRER